MFALQVAYQNGGLPAFVRHHPHMPQPHAGQRGEDAQDDVDAIRNLQITGIGNHPANIPRRGWVCNNANG